MDSYPVQDSPATAIAGDFDADGDLDIPAVEEDQISLLLNDGIRTFLFLQTYPNGGTPEHVCAVDVNGDGDLDLITANGWNDTISVLLNYNCVDSDGDGLGNACNPCDCTYFCDLNLDGSINPVDIVLIVQYVYLTNDLRQPMPTTCPLQNGNWDCFGGINPVDVVWYANHVYLSLGDGPCEPCED